MQMEQILKLVETVSNSTLSSFQYEENGSCLILQQQIQKPVGEEQHISTVMSDKKVNALSNVTEEKEQVSPVIELQGEVVASPLVGVFYAQPAVGAKPYVKVGDKVKKGQIIGIIEAMKLMNEVEATKDGTILEILVQNEQLIEYGQGIVRIG